MTVWPFSLICKHTVRFPPIYLSVSFIGSNLSELLTSILVDPILLNPSFSWLKTGIVNFIFSLAAEKELLKLTKLIVIKAVNDNSFFLLISLIISF